MSNETLSDTKAQLDRELTQAPINCPIGLTLAAKIAAVLARDGELMSLVIDEIRDNFDLKDLAKQLADNIDERELEHEVKRRVEDDLDLTSVVKDIVEEADLEDTVKDVVAENINIEDVVGGLVDNDNFVAKMVDAVMDSEPFQNELAKKLGHAMLKKIGV